MSNSAIAGNTIFEFPAGMIMPYAGSSTPAGWLECNGSEVDISAYPTLAAALGSTWNNAKNPLTGATYANPASGKFRLPDLRGSFLRGSSGGVSNAQGVATGLAEFQSHKTAKNGLANSTSTATAQTLSSSSVSGTTNIGHSHGASSISVDNTNLAHGHSITTGANGRIYTEYFGPAANCRFVGNVGPYQGSNEAYAESNLGNHSHGGTAGGQSLATSNVSLASGAVASLTLNSSSVSAQTITGDAETRPDAVGVRYLIKI